MLQGIVLKGRALRINMGQIFGLNNRIQSFFLWLICSGSPAQPSTGRHHIPSLLRSGSFLIDGLRTFLHAQRIQRQMPPLLIQGIHQFSGFRYRQTNPPEQLYL